MQLARIIGGIASGGHMVRPHAVFPDQLPTDFRKALPESFPGTGDAYVPIDPDNWITVTDGMYQVTQPGAFHTGGAEHLDGIDFGGKTGTAQVMSHQALDKTSKGRATDPNVWFVGITPRRNPELVVAVLWQNGNKSWFAARIGAKIVSSYVEKQRRIANNLVPPAKTATPAEMTALWTVPDSAKGGKNAESNVGPDHLQGGNFIIDHGQIVASSTRKPAVPKPTNAAPPTLSMEATHRNGARMSETPAGAKAHKEDAAYAARLKPCPVTELSGNPKKANFSDPCRSAHVPTAASAGR